MKCNPNITSLRKTTKTYLIRIREKKKANNKNESKEMINDNLFIKNKEEMGITMREMVKGSNVLGLRDLRNSISEVFQRAVNSFEEITIGNAKKGGQTVSIISTELLTKILETYKFNPLVLYDEETKQHEVIINEIPVTGFGDTKEEAIHMAVENTIALTNDYLENKDLYLRLDNMKDLYFYYLRIKHCETTEKIIEVMNLDK